MHVGISALAAHPARFGGAETYLRRLVAALPAIDSSVKYTVFKATGSDLDVPGDNVEVVVLPAPVKNPYTRVLWEHLRQPRYLRRHGVDLMHFPTSTAPFGFPGRSVVTIHDTLRFQVPELTPWLLGKYYGLNQRNIARSGKHVIGVSHADTSLMREELGLPERQVSVVYHGVDRAFFEEDGTTKDDYLLWVGHPYRHKNVEHLFAAYRELKGRGRDLPQLRLIGLNAAEMNRLRPVIQELGIEAFVALEGHTPHDQLPEQLSRAMLFCFPSLCESFGLPVLEAMASGTAVVCSELPCFREICGDHVRYASTSNVGEFADAIDLLLRDGALRSDLANRARAHAAQFTWEACARKTLDVYRQIIHNDD